MSVNNCLFGAVYLMWLKKTLKLKALWRGRIIPHFYIIAPDGKAWHFTVKKDLLPWPLYFLFFLGSYEIMK